jgi:hypothetical protein
MSTIPIITLPPTTRVSKWVSVDDLRYWVELLEPKEESFEHQLALEALREVCELGGGK